MKKIYFGKYVKRDSFFHHFHSLLKFIIILSIILIIGFRWNTQVMIFYSAIFCIIFAISNVKLSEIYSILKPFRFLMLITFLFQYLSTGSELFSWDFVRMLNSLLFSLRFGLLISFSALFTLTTSPIEIVRVLHFVLNPLRFIGMDVERFSLSALVALRFIPVLFKESSLIMNKLKADGTLPERRFSVIRKMDLFLNPLFEKVFHYTDRVGAFLARKNDWTYMLKMKQISTKDIFSFLFLLILVSGGFFV